MHFFNRTLAASLIVTIAFTVRGFSQGLSDAPSLQLGLSGISFAKGNLDPELVAEIVSEKQKEVKVKLVKNMLLYQLGVDNGLFYSFIDHSIDILTTEKDEKTRVKNLLENTVNLAFVVGYADYYVRTLKPGPAWNALRELAMAYQLDSSLFEKSSLSLKDFAKHSKVKKDPSTGFYEHSHNPRISKQNQFVGVIIDLFAEQIRTNEDLKKLGILRTNYLNANAQLNTYTSLENEVLPEVIRNKVERLNTMLFSSQYTEQNQLIQSIRSALCRSTIVTLSGEQVQKLNDYTSTLVSLIGEISASLSTPKSTDGAIEYAYKENYRFFNNGAGMANYLQSEFCIGLDQATQLGPDGLTQFKFFYKYFDTVTKLNILKRIFKKREIADNVFQHVGQNLSLHLKYVGLLKAIVNKGDDWESVLRNIAVARSQVEKEAIRVAIAEAYDRGRLAIGNISDLSRKEISDLEKISAFIDRLKEIELNQFKYIQQFERETRPALAELSKYSSDFREMSNLISQILNSINYSVIEELRSISPDLRLAFPKLLSKIDQFDEVDTYSDFLNQLSDAGDIFSDERMQKSINLVITLIRSYIKVDKSTYGDVGLNLDVEGFLYALQKRPYNKLRPVQFLFTVGVNTASFSKTYRISNSGPQLNNYSYVSEKIGIKLKLWDFKYTRSFAKGETFTYWKYPKLPFLGGVACYVRTDPPHEPVVSNVHLLVYGSGMLYNIANTSTEKQFNAPLLGAGIGVTFFNDLDFNLSIGKPLRADRGFASSSVPRYFNVGFDILFLEYYERLMQKRKANQLQKRLASIK